jgi:fructose-1,6-bisphosphatase/inositol monophosphatase family enzyme
LESWGKIEIYKQKDARDIATKADIEIESFIKEKIQTKWSEHGFWGEEGEKINPNSSFQWLIDPIDGTKFYASLAPFFQTYITLVYEGIPVLGLIYNPLSFQLFSAYQGAGAYLNREKIVLKEPVSLKDAIINIDFGGLIGKNEPEKKWMLDKLSQIAEKSYRIRIIAGALSVYIVTGTIDAYIDLGNSKPQDLAARIIIMQEAGFKIEKIKTDFGEKMIVAREPIFSEIKEILLN